MAKETVKVGFRLTAVACICVWTSIYTAFSQNAEPLAIRISCGSWENTHTPDTNMLWVKDYGYTGGSSANATTTSYIAPQLKKLRFFKLSDGPENCYNVTRLPNGHYSVRMFFGLNEDVLADREPLFDVSIEGTQVYSLKPGWSMNDDQAYVEASVFVLDTAATVCFHSTGHGDPSVMSIEILQLHPQAYDFGAQWGDTVIFRTAKRVDCGADQSVYGESYNADPWGGNRFWFSDTELDDVAKSSTRKLTTRNPIRGTSVAPNFFPEAIYQSASVGTAVGQILNYNFNVEPNANYSVWLHFAEIEDGVISPGQRVFDVLVNGQPFLPNVDIVGIARGPFAAIVLHRTVSVDGRTLTLSFRPNSQKSALVNAIEIFQVIEMEKTTVNTQVWSLRVLKDTLGLPLRFGWNGDPCVPQQHPWSGIDCHFDHKKNTWFIDGLGLDNQGLKGFLSDDIANLQQLQSINLSGNSIQGAIPPALGTLQTLQYLDLSHNMLNGTIPENFGNLTHLKKLYLNGNLLSGRVPAALVGGLIHGASFNFSENAGLCGVPGLPSCNNHLTAGGKAGVAVGVIIGSLLLLLCGTCFWKRRQNILRAQRLALREAPYAKARTHFVRDVQMSRPNVHEHFRAYTDPGPPLLT